MELTNMRYMFGGAGVGYHDPRQIPARGAGYIVDLAPGRHTTFLVGRLLEAGPLPGPYLESFAPRVELRDYGDKSLIYGSCASYKQVFSSAGICKFVLFSPASR